uniref:Uncharacterized protein n=1 Tax=Rhizophora mucronata TaxID=61149 RepID=A0A2P2NAL7_RHIMU
MVNCRTFPPNLISIDYHKNMQLINTIMYLPNFQIHLLVMK